MRYMYDIKLGMLQVLKDEISLRKWSGSTAQLWSLEGTLVRTTKIKLQSSAAGEQRSSYKLHHECL